MRLARIRTLRGTYFARIDGDVAVPVLLEDELVGTDAIRLLHGDVAALADAAAVAEPLPADSVELLAPVRSPSKVLAVGLNYADHASEAKVELPSAPLLFAKTPNAIIGAGQAVRWSRSASTEVDYEAELAVVIGRQARDVRVERALDHVLGYTACNDVSARDAQRTDGQWVRAKSFDTFCPLGPWLVTSDKVRDPQNLRIACRVNGATMQDDTTKNMIFGVAEIVAYASRFMTLEPGDVIATGTPPGVGFTRQPPVYLEDGDVVEVEIEDIGVLTNPVEVTP